MEMDIEGGNQISCLPDALLSQIISYLSVPETVRTNILTGRWKNIWKSSCLHFKKQNFLPNKLIYLISQKIKCERKVKKTMKVNF